MPKSFRKVTHCIFDMDGLLLDTEPVYEQVMRQIASAFGKTYPSEFRYKVLGTTGQRRAEIVVNDLKLPLSVEEFLEHHYSLCLQLLGNRPLLKGAQRLVCHLHENEIPICLATSSGKDIVAVKTKNHSALFELFHHKVCGSTDPDVKHGKPAPDIFLVAASRFDDTPDPKHCLVFEDSPNGVQAALTAGMQVVMVPDKECPKELTTKATQVLSSLEDFEPEKFGLPPFK